MIYSNIGYRVSSQGIQKQLDFLYENRNSAKLTLCTTTTASTTTTSKPPEEGGTYNYPVPEDSLILPTKNTPSSSATDKKQAKKTFSPQSKKTVPARKSVTSIVELQGLRKYLRNRCIHTQILRTLVFAPVDFGLFTCNCTLYSEYLLMIGTQSYK